MIGRAAIGNPWFFSGKMPSISERLKAIVEHAELFDDPKRFNVMKKHFHAYAKEFKGAKEIRDRLMEVKDYADVKKLIEKFLLRLNKD